MMKIIQVLKSNDELKLKLKVELKRNLPLWSSGYSSWLQIQRSRIRIPALSDFLRSSGSGTGSTEPREYN
jgi:hypothetical protein